MDALQDNCHTANFTFDSSAQESTESRCLLDVRPCRTDYRADRWAELERPSGAFLYLRDAGTFLIKKGAEDIAQRKQNLFGDCGREE